MAELLGTSLFSSANLLHYYTLEDANDDKGSTNLTNNGTVTFSAAKYLNGADGGATNTTKWLNDPTSGTNGIDGGACSIGGWVKLQTEIASGTYTLFYIASPTGGTKSTYQLRYEYNSGTLRLAFNRSKGGVGTDGVNYTVTLGTGSYHHIALTYDAVTLRGYYNGVDIGNTAASGSGSSENTKSLSILADTDGNNKTSGIMDDCFVFDRALTAAEVRTLGTDAGGSFLFNFL